MFMSTYHSLLCCQLIVNFACNLLSLFLIGIAIYSVANAFLILYMVSIFVYLFIFLSCDGRAEGLIHHWLLT